MHFHNHPLINKIVEHKLSAKWQLVELSGMGTDEFRKAFRSLLSGGHLMHRYEQLRLRTLTLTVIDKKSKRYIEGIELKYLSRKELNKIIFYDERSEDFLEGCFLEEKHASFFAEANDIDFDFTENEYNLSIEYVDLAYDPKKYRYGESTPIIVHVDADKAFSAGFKTLVEEEFSRCYVQYFTHAEYAWKYLRLCFTELENIKLIVTDIDLPDGIDGVEFSKAVWDLEIACKQKHIPMLALTMHGDDSPIKEMAMGENLFERWFTKDVKAEVVTEYLSTLMKPEEWLDFNGRLMLPADL